MPEAPPPSVVENLERLAARTWRGLEEEPYGDWLLRAGGGFTGRANSVLVVGEPPEPLDRAVATVTRWYERRGLRPRAYVPSLALRLTGSRLLAVLPAVVWVAVAVGAMVRRPEGDLILTAGGALGIVNLAFLLLGVTAAAFAVGRTLGGSRPRPTASPRPDPAPHPAGSGSGGAR